MTPTRLLREITPPRLWRAGQDLKRRMLRSVDHTAYAPDGWQTRLPAGQREAFWTRRLPQARAAAEQMIAWAKQPHATLASAADEVFHLLFGHVLALAARDRRHVTVLDYGGSLGEYYWVGRALVPGVELDFHCKELAPLAEAGRTVNPAVTWHTDDRCFEQTFDVVMFCSSLQYVEDWRDTLGRAGRSTRRHLLLCDIPAVRHVAGFVATQRTGGVITLHHQFNLDELLAVAADSGLHLIRAFHNGPHPPVANAPEQPACVGLLFGRDD